MSLAKRDKLIQEIENVIRKHDLTKYSQVVKVCIEEAKETGPYIALYVNKQRKQREKLPKTLEGFEVKVIDASNNI